MVFFLGKKCVKFRKRSVGVGVLKVNYIYIYIDIYAQYIALCSSIFRMFGKLIHTRTECI